MEDAQGVEVCCLGLKEEYDRRGLLLKCSVVGSDKTRMIPLEELVIAKTEGNFDENDAQKIAERVISDYCFWVIELRGLDPSSNGFHQNAFGDLLHDGDFDEGSYFSDEGDGSLMGSELEFGFLPNSNGDFEDDDEDMEQDIIFGEGEDGDIHDENDHDYDDMDEEEESDENNWKIGYDEDLG